MDPESWFATGRGDVAAAKALCRDCPLRLQCLEAGMEEEFGVWGGLDPAQRRRIRRGTKTCETCPTVMHDVHPNTRYCPACRRAARAATHHRYDTQARHAA